MSNMIMMPLEWLMQWSDGLIDKNSMKTTHLATLYDLDLDTDYFDLLSVTA